MKRCTYYMLKDVDCKVQIIKWVENTKMFFVITFEVSLVKRLSYEKVLLKNSAASSFQNGKMISDYVC